MTGDWTTMLAGQKHLTGKTSAGFVKALLALLLALGLPGAPGLAAPGSGAVIVVNTFQDELNQDGDCSLREALLSANANTGVDGCEPGTGADTIMLPAGVFNLSLSGADDLGYTGDLDILEALTMTGAGPNETWIDGQQASDRVIHIATTEAVRIGRLGIRNGQVVGGGLLGGAGILNESGSLVLWDAVIQDNFTSQVGGGLDNAGTATLLDVYITGNHASAGGGVFNGGSLLIRNSTFNANSANHTGGALDNALNATLENVTISANTTPITNTASGGGIFTDGPLYLLNATITENSSGIHNQDVVRFKNTMIVNSSGGDNCTGTGTYISEGYNLDSGSSCKFNSNGDLQNTDPLLGPLTTNDGPTFTHALLPGSLAIDGGDNLDCPSADQRGAYRPADGDGDSVQRCDIGAFEYLGVFPKFLYLPAVSR